VFERAEDQCFEVGGFEKSVVCQAENNSTVPNLKDCCYRGSEWFKKDIRNWNASGLSIPKDTKTHTFWASRAEGMLGKKSCPS